MYEVNVFYNKAFLLTCCLDTYFAPTDICFNFFVSTIFNVCAYLTKSIF